MPPRAPPMTEPIAAIATAPGRGGIGVVRVSCADPQPFMIGLLGRQLQPRHAHRARFLDARGETLDDGLALWFPAPRSFTGEHVLELQGHGGPHVLQAVLARCLELGARLAEPGEFSRRAFLNGKLDLAQAEAVADLIDAGSRQAARSALRALQGEFSQRVQRLRQGLIELRLRVEAELDFAEEEVEVLAASDLVGRLTRLLEQLEAVLATARQGVLLRDGLNVVLIGQPNVGKSSLLNQLAGYDAAIVTEHAGTTRDTLREQVQIEGVPLHIIDTAGLRDSDDPIERLGMERTWAALARADIALLLTDAQHGVGAAEAGILQRLPAIPRLTVHNKIDQSGDPARVSDDGSQVWLSAKHGQGVDLLRQRLLALAGWQQGGEDVCSARTRHLDALRRCRHHLAAAAALGAQAELLAEELRLAQDVLGEITGEYTSDDLLGAIFAQFCIGK